MQLSLRNELFYIFRIEESSPNIIDEKANSELTLEVNEVKKDLNWEKNSLEKDLMDQFDESLEKVKDVIRNVKI